VKHLQIRHCIVAGFGYATFFAGVLFAPATLADSEFTIVNAVIVGGSATTLGNSCSRLSATIGQPAVGYSSGGTFSISSGFWAVSPDAGDSLFFDGFEGCTP
jgi:hypothetical protein